ncbi:MAG: helix-turn-helix transcriptional regulator [Candidatus Aenigmatarchaeota archaeon]
MTKQCENIYKTARKFANLTQEEAAELLFISPRTLSEYENGRLVPPDDVVAKMVEIYQTPWLAYQHLQRSTQLGQKYLPELDSNDLPKAVLKLRKEMNDVEKINDIIVDIACDGEIRSNEKITWNKVIKEIKEMISAALSVCFIKEGA